MKTLILQILVTLLFASTVLKAETADTARSSYLYEDVFFSNVNPADPKTLWRGRLRFALPHDWATRVDLQNHFFVDLTVGRYDLEQKIIDRPLEEWQVTEKDIRIAAQSIPLTRFPIAEHLVEIQFPDWFPIRKMMSFPKIADWGTSMFFAAEPPPPVRYFALFDKDISIFTDGHPEQGLALDQRGLLAPTVVRTLILRDWFGTSTEKQIEIEKPTPDFQRPYFWFGNVFFRMIPLSTESLQQKIDELRSCSAFLTRNNQTARARD